MTTPASLGDVISIAHEAAGRRCNLLLRDNFATLHVSFRHLEVVPRVLALRGCPRDVLVDTVVFLEEQEIVPNDPTKHRRLQCCAAADPRHKNPSARKMETCPVANHALPFEYTT